MLNRLIRLSLAQRVLVVAMAAVLLALGLKKALELPVDVLPDLTKPTVTILTEAPGYAPEEVETLVTIPLENSLMGVTGVNRLRSINDISLSLIFVEFDWGTDIYQARQFVQERLTGAVEILPAGITPYMTPVASLMGDIMMVGLRDPSGETSPRDLRELADWVVGKRFQSIPGIAEVLSMGGGVKQIQVQPDPDKMLTMGVTFEQIRAAAAAAVRNTTGGFLTERDQEIMVRNLAMTTDLDAIGDTVVMHENDRAIRLKTSRPWSGTSSRCAATPAWAPDRPQRRRRDHRQCRRDHQHPQIAGLRHHRADRKGRGGHGGTGRDPS